jgi:hypothetical protein
MYQIVVKMMLHTCFVFHTYLSWESCRQRRKPSSCRSSCGTDYQSCRGAEDATNATTLAYKAPVKSCLCSQQNERRNMLTASTAGQTWLERTRLYVCANRAAAKKAMPLLRTSSQFDAITSNGYCWACW